MPSTLRFFHQFLVDGRGSSHGVVREETSYRRDGQELPASLYYPVRRGGRPTRAGRAGELPGWVALHGLSCRGREHPSLDRLARAVAASGAVVLIPDLPEWRALRVAPGPTVDTIRAAVLQLDGDPRTAPGRVGVIGFSFGATQALVAATDPALEGHLAGVVCWGGYADIRKAIRFGFTGDHALDGRAYRLDPDPYGRWIIAANYLPLLPEHRDDRALTDAFHELADIAGRRLIESRSPATDPLKRTARTRLTAGQREVFDLLAPPAGQRWTEAERSRVGALADRLAAAAVDAEPQLDAAAVLGRVPVPVLLAHGRDDRLMPWTEMVRLERGLPADRVAYSGITELFSHSFGESRWPTPRAVLEAGRFVRLIHRMLRLI